VESLEIAPIDGRDEPLVRAWWELSRAAELASRPYDFFPAWESTWHFLSEGRADLDLVLLGGFEAGRLRGGARLEHPLTDNRHLVTAAFAVDPEHQRRGIGRALAEASYDLARGRGRRVMATEAYAPVDGASPGVLFAEAMGFSQALTEGIKVLDLVQTEALWDDLEARASARRGDYRVIAWRDRVPDELVAGFCRLMELFIVEAPMGTLQVEPERWDEDRLRDGERSNVARGRRSMAAGAVTPDGGLVAVTELFVRDGDPRGFQSGTLVDPAHRGHSLGLAVKVANHRQVRVHAPYCRLVVTGNADVNAAMNAVNDALGYREVERCVELQREL
jgi:GNAT superfamily N-acetyltransferase